MAEYRHQRDVDAGPIRPIRVLGLASSAGIGLLLGFVALNQTVTKSHWHPPLPRFEEISAEVETQKDQVDLLFLGPSHMMTDIDPRLFDARATELGMPLHSYNFSVEGLRVSERDRLLETLRRIHPSKLKYILVKPDIWLHTDLENAFSTRARYFNTPANTRRDLTVRLGSTKPFWRYDVPTGVLISLGGLTHLANVGVLSDLMLPHKGALKGPARENHPERQGFVPMANPHRQLPASDDSPYPAERSEAPVRPLSTGEKALMAELFQAIRDLGAEPIVVIPPVSNDNLAESEETLQSLRTDFPELAVLAFHQTSANPGLYERLAYWDDLNHLSVEGAEVFSRLLADAFVELLAKRGATR